MTTMLTNHIAIYFLEENSSPYIVKRTVGRLAFPLFCFSLVGSFGSPKIENDILSTCLDNANQ